MSRTARRGLAAALGICALIATSASAADQLEATSSVELSDDPGFEGLYKYTVRVSWEFDQYAAGHLDFFLDVAAFDDTCSANSVHFPAVAGTSTGEDDLGAPCSVDYLGEFLCKTDPSLQQSDLGLSIKYEPLDANCFTGTNGTGTFCFYTAVPPGLPGLHDQAVAIRHGRVVTLGPLFGPLPGTDGLVETGLALINEFLVRPKPGDDEFIEVFNPGSEPVDVTDWTIEVNGEVVKELTGTLDPGGFESESTFVTGTEQVIDFDFDASGNSIPPNQTVNFTYFTSRGVEFTTLLGPTAPACADPPNVFASDQAQQFSLGDSNVVSIWPIGCEEAQFSEQEGVIQADFCDLLDRVCIEVWPMTETSIGFLAAYDDSGAQVDSALSTPGVNEEICVDGPNIAYVRFAGLGTEDVVFDNMRLVYPPGFLCVFAPGSRPFGTAAAQQDEGDVLPDPGGTIVLRDDDGVVQDSVAYGNQGGAPISAPIVFPPGFPRPPVFQAAVPFGTQGTAQEPDTSSTSTERVPNGQDTGSSADDFNLGSPTPEESNDGSVETPALGSSIRTNGVYAKGLGTDAVEFFNPTSNLVDMSGWFVSDGSVVTPIYTSGNQPVPTGETALLPQGYPQTFSFELDYEDVFYLYDTNLVRLDQLGWTQTPFFFPDSCLVRSPDGAGPADGYDFNTSGGSSGNLLYLPCDLQDPGQVVDAALPLRFRTQLAAPYPNPTVSESQVAFVVGGESGMPVSIDVAVYDVAGRRLGTLFRGEAMPGPRIVRWDGRAANGGPVGAGVYFVRLKVQGESQGLSRTLVRRGR